MTRKFFGTDGIRGKVGCKTINPEFVLKLGWAAGKVLLNGKTGGKVLIGKDTRISGYMLESCLEAGLSSAGIKSFLTGPLPTPAISYLTRSLSMDFGIVISASHNPYYDNGIKFFSAEGTKLPDEVELEIEKMIGQPLSCVESDLFGKAERIQDVKGRYIEFCKSALDIKNNFKGMSIVIDCANGATYSVAPRIFEDLGADIHTIGISPNGTNINLDCGSTDVALLRKTVIEKQADLGIAYDGDGDRLIMVDHLGNIIEGDTIMYILAKYEKAIGNLKPNQGVVGTVMSNNGLIEAFNKLDIPFERSAVGDRYVLQKMQENNWYLGGENSGHIIHYKKNPTGDGIIASLCVIQCLKYFNITLNEISREIRFLPQFVESITINGLASNFLEQEDTINIIKQAEELVSSNGRVLIRKSGTEPLIRVMVEHEDESTARKSLSLIKNFINSNK